MQVQSLPSSAENPPAPPQVTQNRIQRSCLEALHGFYLRSSSFIPVFSLTLSTGCLALPPVPQGLCACCQEPSPSGCLLRSLPCFMRASAQLSPYPEALFSFSVFLLSFTNAWHIMHLSVFLYCNVISMRREILFPVEWISSTQSNAWHIQVPHLFAEWTCPTWALPDEGQGCC